MKKETVLTWLRWIGILPCSLLASVIVYLLYYYSSSFFADPNSGYTVYVAPIIASLVSGIAFIQAGKYIAPGFKKQVSFTLLCIVLLLSGAGIFLDIANKEYFQVLKLIASLAGTIIGFFMPLEGEE